LNQLNNQYKTVQDYITNNAALINQSYVKNVILIFLIIGKFIGWYR